MEKEKDTVLVAVDEPAQDLLRSQVEKAGWRALPVRHIAEVCSRMPEAGAVLLDTSLTGFEGKDTVKRLKATRHDVAIVMVSGSGPTATVLECLQAGASDYVQKPYEVERLRVVLKNALRARDLERTLKALREDLWATRGFSRIVGRSARMQEVYRLMGRVVDSDQTVLLLGERGSGLETTARALHEAGARREGPFVAIDLAALSPEQRERELLGGPGSELPGKIMEADSGTLFINEIGALPAAAQARFLAVLESHSVPRGEGRPFKVDVRWIVSTGQDLRRECQAGTFRSDLFERLSNFVISLPPLRERLGDLPLLAAHFLREAMKRTGRSFQGFEPEAMRVLETHPWPGNVRELQNAVDRAALLETGSRIGLSALPDTIIGGRTAGPASAGGASAILTFDDEERRIIERALFLTGGNIMEASHRLGLSRATLYRKIKRYGLRKQPATVGPHAA
jgi:DNA-binding NtrC family response regulator